MSVDDTTPATSPSPATPYASDAGDRPVRSGTGFATVLLMSVLAAGGGAGLALFAQTQPAVTGFLGLKQAETDAGRLAATDAALQREIDGLEARLAALETRTAAAPTAPTTPSDAASSAVGPSDQGTGVIADAAPALPPVSPADIGGLRAELQGLAGRLTAIETRLGALDPTGAGGAMIAGLQADVAALKAAVEGLRVAQASGPAPGVAFAAIALAEAASRPGPFIAEWEAMRAALPGNTAVEALAALARSGAPTRASLVERFPAVSDAVRRAARQEEAGTGFLGWLSSLWKSLVVVRSTAPSASNGPEGLVARAEIKLGEGDFAGAVEEVASLEGEAAVPAQEWLRHARARLEIERRIATVRGTLERGPPAPLAPLFPSPSVPTTAAAPTPTQAEPAQQMAPAPTAKGANP